MSSDPLGEINRRDRLKAHLATRTAKRAKSHQLSSSTDLLGFIPQVTPRFTPPVHLSKFALALEWARKMPVRLVVSVPPRHGKTELILHGIAWHLQRDPACEIAYIGYSQTFARSKSFRLSPPLSSFMDRRSSSFAVALA